MSVRRNPVRKPAATAGKEPTCMCGHPAPAHAAGACAACDDCDRFRPRPCVCGHPASLHTIACQDPQCACRRFREDQSPEVMLRMGIRAGEWRFDAVPRLKFMMRPGPEQWVRVWACGMLHTGGRRGKGRLAVRFTGKDVTVPLQPGDIVDELNVLDTLGRMTRQSVHKALRELERMGAARQVGKTRKHIRLFFYARPLPSRTVAPEPDLVLCTEYQIFASDSKDDHLRDSLFLPIRNTVVKGFMRALREELGGQPDLVLPPEYQNAVEEILQSPLLVLQEAYQKLRLVLCSAPAYKEVSISVSRQAGTDAPGEPAACLPAEALPPPKLAALCDLFPEDYLNDQALQLLDGRIAAELGSAYDRERFVVFVHRRHGRNKIGPGLLFAQDGLAAEYCKNLSKMAAKEAAAVRPAWTREDEIQTLTVDLEFVEGFPQHPDTPDTLAYIERARIERPDEYAEALDRLRVEDPLWRQNREF